MKSKIFAFHQYHVARREMDNDIVITFCDSVLVIKIPTTGQPRIKDQNIIKNHLSTF
jgi:hypothetical protein